MENLKKGDIVFIKKKQVLPIFTRDEIIFNHFVNKDIINVSINFDMLIQDIKKIGASQMQYEESNCYKLKQAIKKTGISSEKLSLATTKGKTKYHFYSYTKKSRLTDRGDISEARLNKLLTDLRHAEREVLGIGAKTVEESPKFTINGKPVEAKIIGKGNYLIDMEKDLIDEAVEYTGAQYDEGKPKSNKPLFIGAAVVIFIVLILFILNNSQVV